VLDLVILPVIPLDLFSQCTDLEAYHLKIASHEKLAGVTLHHGENMLNLRLSELEVHFLSVKLYEYRKEGTKRRLHNIC